MTVASRSRMVRASRDTVWAVLADFGAVAAWAEEVDHSCLLDQHAEAVGTARRVQIGRDTLIETITRFDPPGVLAYDITGLPAFVAASNRWTLEPGISGGTFATLTSTVHVTRRLLRFAAEPAMARLMAGRSEALLKGLATASEGVAA